MSERTGQPTEAPTQRRQEQAAKDGQIAFSSELIGGLTTLGAIIFFMQMGTWFFEVTQTSIRESLTFFGPMVDNPETILLAMQRQVMNVGKACLSLMVPLAMLAVLAGAAMTRFNFSTKPLEAKWSKISPMSGLKRIFSTRSLNKGGVAIVKSTVVIIVAYWITASHQDEIFVAGMGSYAAMLNLGTSIILEIGMVVALLMVAVGAADLGFQIWKQNQDLMMTKQEIRDEQKDSDGDPQLKARLRRLRNEMSQQQVSRDVPQATVIVTNPTHFAVALRYNPDESKAPIVVAKGADHLAKRIIQVGKDSGVAVVERKPVARFLYAHVEVGREIPLELFEAVAEILNYIRRLEKQAV